MRLQDEGNRGEIRGSKKSPGQDHSLGLDLPDPIHDHARPGTDRPLSFTSKILTKTTALTSPIPNTPPAPL